MTVIWIRVNTVDTCARTARIAGVTLAFSSKGRPEWISRMARNRKRYTPLLTHRVLPEPVDEPRRRNEPDDRRPRTTCLEILRENTRTDTRHTENSSRRREDRHQSTRTSKTTHSSRGGDSRDRIRKKLKIARLERRSYVEV